MTDNEIIKALECCCNPCGNDCEECPRFYQDYDTVIECGFTLMQDALALINRQQAEIDRLKEYEDIRPAGCPKCSRGNFSNSKFCSHCGTKLQGR